MSPPGGGRGWRRWVERGVGVFVGLLLGVGIVIVFVFLGSEDTIDAPRISGIQGEQEDQSGRAGERDSDRRPEPPPIATVRVRGGAPPASGPPRLEFRLGSTARFRVVSDAPVAIEVLGYRIAETVESAAVISFRASRAGQFPVVVTGSNIGIASLRVRN